MKLTAKNLPFNTKKSLPKWAQDEVASMLHAAQEDARKTIALAQAETAIAQARATELKFHNDKLIFELHYLRRMRYGAKTEHWSDEQKDLFQENFTSDIAAIEAELAQKTADAKALQDAQPKTPRERAGRQALPAHLPRVDVIHDIATCDCAACGKALVKIGEDVTEKLTVKPAVFSVERHITPKYACRACEIIVAEPVAPAIIDSGYASVELLTWMIVCKYVDHLPLYRLEQIGERHGVPLPRSTLAEWVGKVGVALHPLAERLRELLKQRKVLHADETPVAQLDPKAGKNKRTYLWVYRSNDLEEGPPIVVYDYRASRAGMHAKSFLESWQGHLMVDDYSGYKGLFENGIVELGCMVHARRKFFDLHASTQSQIAAKALDFFGLLYQVEKHAQNLDANARKIDRQAHSVPILKAFHEWLTKTRTTTASGTAVRNAIDYSLRRWPALIRYAQTGHLPIDNNPAENAVRPIAIGRKNWLHYGSQRAGERAADIQSLLATAKLNGINPEEWLADVLEKLPTWPNSRLDELLPLRKTTPV